jgi:hypothetical protein
MTVLSKIPRYISAPETVLKGRIGCECATSNSDQPKVCLLPGQSDVYLRLSNYLQHLTQKSRL